jgi:hypothetical protein
VRRQLAARLARLAAALDDEVWRNPARSGADGFDEDLWHAVRGVESVELVSLAIDDDGVHELRLGVPTDWSSAEISSAVFRILGAVAEQVTFVDCPSCRTALRVHPSAIGRRRAASFPQQIGDREFGVLAAPDGSYECQGCGYVGAVPADGPASR